MNDKPAYQHTQRASFCVILYALAVLELMLAWQARHEPALLGLFLTISVLLLVLAASFHYLKVTDTGDRLLVSFGPLPVFQRTVRYEDITSAELGRTSWLDGWGIHWRPRRGWLWNIWGTYCVVIRLRKGALRIGSDDAERLAAFLQSRVSPLSK